jgi:hypothetical protein
MRKTYRESEREREKGKVVFFSNTFFENRLHPSVNDAAIEG